MRKKLAVILAATLALGSISFPAYAADADYDSVEWEVVGEADVEEGEDQGYDEDVNAGDSYDEGDFIDIEVDEETWEDAEELGYDGEGEDYITTEEVDETVADPHNEDNPVYWNYYPETDSLTGSYWTVTTTYVVTTNHSTTPETVTKEPKAGVDPVAKYKTVDATILSRTDAYTKSEEETAETEDSDEEKGPQIEDSWFAYMSGTFTTEENTAEGKKEKVTQEFKTYEALEEELMDEVYNDGEGVEGYRVTVQPTCLQPGTAEGPITYYLLPDAVIGASGEPTDWDMVMAYNKDGADDQEIPYSGHDWEISGDTIYATELVGDLLTWYKGNGGKTTSKNTDFNEENLAYSFALPRRTQASSFYSTTPSYDNNVYIGEDGYPTAIDPDCSFVFYEITPVYCDRDKVNGLNVVKRFLEKVDVNTAWVNDLDNIFGYFSQKNDGTWEVEGAYDQMPENLLPENPDHIILEDCDKKGSYTVSREIILPSDECVEEDLIGRFSYDEAEQVVVDPHHAVVFTIEADRTEVARRELLIKYGKYTLGTQEVNDPTVFFPISELDEMDFINNCCWKTVDYTINAWCVNDDIPEDSWTETLPVSTNHMFAEDQKRLLADVEDGIILNLGRAWDYSPTPEDRNENYWYLKTTQEGPELHNEIVNLPEGYGVSFSDDDSGHDHPGTVTMHVYCARCGEDVLQVKVPVRAHTAIESVKKVKEEEIVPVSCDHEGITRRYTLCDICGEPVNYSDVVVPKLAHTFGDVDFDVEADDVVVARQLTDLNFNERRLLQQAYEAFQENGYTAAGAYMAWNIDSEGPTVGRPKYRVDASEVAWTCTVCGEELEDVNVNNHLRIYITDLEEENANDRLPGHITVEVIATGVDADGEPIVERAVFEKPYYSDWLAYMDRVTPGTCDHHFVKDEERSFDPTCGEDGLEVDVCTICGKVVENKVPATGKHTWDDGKVTKEPTTTEPGERTFTCTVCGETKVEKIDPLPPVKNGFINDGDNWRLYKDGVVDTSYTDIYEYQGGKFFLSKGELCQGANGLNLNVADNKWYFLAYGQVQIQHTGLAMYDGEWFYITNGELAEDVNGLVPYDGGTFAFAAGRLLREVSGFWIYGDEAYFLSAGQVQTEFTGVVSYKGANFYVVAGKFASDYSGQVTFNGITWNVINGQAYAAA